MSATQRRGAERRPSDQYESPAWSVRAILPHLPVGPGTILEPCAGRGAILRVLREAGVESSRLYAIEIDETLAADIQVWLGDVNLQIADALTSSWLQMPHGLWVVNPPFSQAMDFVERGALAAKTTGTTAAFLLRLGFLEGLKRAAFHKEHPSDVFPLARRPSFTGQGTDATAYAWFVFGPGRGNRWQVLPCAKEGA